MVADEKYPSCTVRLSDHHSHTLLCPTWRGVATERGVGRFSGLNAKPDTNSQPYLTMYQIRRPLGLVFVIYFWWLGELLLLYI
jgi:hypothetical protein